MDLNDLPKEAWVGLVGLILVGLGIFVFKSKSLEPSSEVQVLSSSSSSGQMLSNDIYVDISGAVVLPGVYQLEPKARVEDVLKLAGGIAPDADTKWIETNLNRAMVISDGMKIYIPRLGETVSRLAANKISLNSASQAELESLPGIGEGYAVKIIANRPYSRIEDLLAKKVIGEKLLSRIKDLIGL